MHPIFPSFTTEYEKSFLFLLASFKIRGYDNRLCSTYQLLTTRKLVKFCVNYILLTVRRIAGITIITINSKSIRFTPLPVSNNKKLIRFCHSRAFAIRDMIREGSAWRGLDDIIHVATSSSAGWFISVRIARWQIEKCRRRERSISPSIISDGWSGRVNAGKERQWE